MKEAKHIKRSEKKRKIQAVLDLKIFKYKCCFLYILYYSKYYDIVRDTYEECVRDKPGDRTATCRTGFRFRPEEGLVGELLEFLEGYEKRDRYRIPDVFPDPKWKNVIKGYWPFEVDMRNKTVREVHGITVCAAYYSQNVLMNFSDMKGFYL